MNFKVVLLPRDRRELLEGWVWYEDKQKGLGDKFKKEVYDTINHILSYPEHYPLKTRIYREAVEMIFPYIVIYRVLKKEKMIVVLSIFNAGRNPKEKYK